MNGPSLIGSVGGRFPYAVSASHTYRGDAIVVLRRKSARFLKESSLTRRRGTRESDGTDEEAA